MLTNDKFSYESKRKKDCSFPQEENQYCVFHPGLYILNFCQSPQCLLPLCAECVKLHSIQHRKNNTFGDFETIDGIIEKLMDKLFHLKQNFKLSSNRISNCKERFRNLENILIQEILDQKSKVIHYIDDFFEEVILKAKNLSNENRNNLGEEIHAADKNIIEKIESINAFEQKLKGRKFLKYLIQYFEMNFFNENSKYYADVTQYIEFLENNIVKPVIDDSVLANLKNDLQNFISFEYEIQNNYENYQQNHRVYNLKETRKPNFYGDFHNNDNFIIQNHRDFQLNPNNYHLNGNFHPNTNFNSNQHFHQNPPILLNERFLFIKKLLKLKNFIFSKKKKN